MVLATPNEEETYLEEICRLRQQFGKATNGIQDACYAKNIGLTRLDGCQRQEHGQPRVWQGKEAVMLVESRCRLVLGIHNQGEGGNLRTGSTVERVGQ